MAVPVSKIRNTPGKEKSKNLLKSRGWEWA